MSRAGFTIIGDAAQAVAARIAAERRKLPRSAFGRRQLAAWIDLHDDPPPDNINFDIDPHRWAMEHEISCAAMVARHVKRTE